MNNIYFKDVIETGNLYPDHILYEFEQEPILFLCTDDKKELYLCLCSDIRYEQKWMVVKCRISTLKALLEEKLDIASAFLLSEAAIIITMDLSGNERSSVMDMDKIDRLDLPEEGTFLKCDRERAFNYLWKKEWEHQTARQAN